MEIQLGRQPRVLNPQGTSMLTLGSEGERLGSNGRHKDLGHKTQPRCLLPIGMDELSEALPGWFPLGPTEQSFACGLSGLLEN